MWKLVWEHPSRHNIALLGEVRSESTVKSMLALLPRNQGEVSQALRAAPRSLVVPLLREGYERGGWLRERGASVLAEIDGADAIPWLITALSDKLRSVRLGAEVALGGLGPIAVPSLLIPARGSDTLAREHALAALAVIGDSAAGAELFDAAQSGPDGYGGRLAHPGPFSTC